MMIEPHVIEGIMRQAEHVARNQAPATARICRSLIALAQGDSACGRRIADWPPTVLRDAMPLRLTGALHDLHLRGIDDRLDPVYRGDITDQEAVDTLVCQIVERYDEALLLWLDGPPQTNEAGRSANFVAALHWLASRVQPRFEVNEIGASAGLNLLIDRYHYDLGGIESGPLDSPVTIRPEWQGDPPPSTPFSFTSVQGCDLTPIDLGDEAQAARLRAYVWPEATERFLRLDRGIDMIREKPIDLVAADAADWVEKRLTVPQEEDTTRVLLHSIMWQYLPDASQARITRAMEAAGAHAQPRRTLAWIAVETNITTFKHELKVRFWPSNGATATLAEAQAHGQWVRWFGTD